MRSPHGRPSEGIRKYSLTDLEMDWFLVPLLKLAGSDLTFRKKATIDLDPAGGAVPQATISLGGLSRTYVVIDKVDITPADAFSMRNGTVEQFMGSNPTDFNTPINTWRQLDQTISPGPANEAEFAVNDLFVIDPGRIWNTVFTNLSPLGRVMFDVDISGYVSRVRN